MKIVAFVSLSLISISSLAMSDEFYKKQDEYHKQMHASLTASITHNHQSMALHFAQVASRPAPGQPINTTHLDATLRNANVSDLDRQCQIIRATNYNNSLNK